LNSFGDRVNYFHLLAVMLIVKQMQLVEGRTSDLPMTLLVQVAKRHRVGKKLVQLFGHLQSHGFFEFQWQRVADRAVGLDFPSALVKAGLGADNPAHSCIDLFLWHWHLLSADIAPLHSSIQSVFPHEFLLFVAMPQPSREHWLSRAKPSWHERH